MVRRLALLLAAACLLVGCGEEATGSGSAKLWITRDRGEEVVLSTTVPAGISAMEALRRKADVDTRYGGRFVQSINGIEGSLSDRYDWFFFVNGYEADLSAADYKLSDGDVLWWDVRSWAGEMRRPAVVGAFPEPFLHGFGGKRRPAVVRGPDDATSRRIAKLIGGRLNEDQSGANRLDIVEGTGFRVRVSGAPGDPVIFELGREDAKRLAADPTLARYRYEGLSK